MGSTGPSDEVLLGTLALRIARNEDGHLSFREESVIGDDLLEEKAAQQFVDVFTSWHKGGFVPEFVQDGFYHTAENVDCTKPGEIKPGPRRITTLNINKGANDHYGVQGLLYAEDSDTLIASIKSENAGGDNVPNRITIKLIDANYTEPALTSQDLDIATAAVDFTGRPGFTSPSRPLRHCNAAGAWKIVVCYGAGYRLFDVANVGSDVVVDAHEIVIAGQRGYKVSLSAGAEISLSNIDLQADWAVNTNWVTATKLKIQECPQVYQNAGVSIGVLGEVPYAGGTEGVFALGRGGVPFNLFPQLTKAAQAHANGFPLTQMAGGIGFGTQGPGHIHWFTESFGTSIGPSTNPLARPDNVKIMHMFEAPNGDLWVLAHRYEVANAEGVWEMWVGKKQLGAQPGPGAYAWHPVLRDDNTNEGGPDNSSSYHRRDGIYRPFLPFWFQSTGSERPEIAIGTGHGTGVCRLTFVEGGLYYDLEDYDHEDNQASYNVPVTWEGGRYARHDRRAKRHWTALHFKGKNINTSGNEGGTIGVWFRADGAGFYTSAGTLDSDVKTIAIDARGYDLEVRLVWGMNGNTGTMKSAPATVTEIGYEGAEIPRPIRALSMVVLADAPPQAGGVRQTYRGSDLLSTLEGLVDGAKLPFRDPYKESRTVVVVPPQVLTPSEAEGLKVPEGSVALTVLEVAS